MMTVNNRFGILLAEKRITEKRNIPLAEVEQMTGIPRKTLYAWQNNKVTRYDATIINSLCRYFACEPGNLFHYVPDNK